MLAEQRSWKSIATYILPIMLILLSCNSGGGSDSDDESDTTDTQQPSALTVVSTNPQGGASGIDPNTTIMVQFSETIDPSSVTGTTFLLISDDSVLATCGVNCLNNTATLTPRDPLLNGSSYTAIITIGVRGINGELLSQEYSWEFSTAQSDTVNPNPSVFTPYGSISGVVFDGMSMTPIQGAVVSVTYSDRLHQVTTGTTGAYSFSNVPAPEGGQVYEVTCDLTEVSGFNCILVKSIQIGFSDLSDDTSGSDGGADTPVDSLAGTLTFMVDPSTCTLLE
ncbi:MAG TPA: Ig-like domain-containing protein [Deltaproteobacteria bacterium]|nr:Ig-like domain-containing protein [Deltaproteobacteria bacterium]HNS89837.1 Ig-like domain-containing protein [Deltaproteobacteria bacterium]HOA44733.1 Ig-like domain-containing protein [Deltaproteobacteria bacterium]HOC75741.1 Ig-like domain-containing protein [Deltaproteobacteria bacterium]HOG84458.1 Ig-like domain-containing protein [Deltaproteobacteria bacterium]